MFSSIQFDITSFILGIFLGSVLSLAFAIPRVGRILAGILSVMLIAAGAGFLIWAGASLLGVESFRPIGSERLNVSTPVEALRLGGGLLIGGFLAIYLSLSSPRR